MAKVDKLRPETITRLKGLVDFYTLRGKITVARKWPRKPRPPYTSLQAEAMLVFAMSKKYISKISLHMVDAWKRWNAGKREQWPDEFTGIIMRYWKETRVFCPVALDYEITEDVTTWKCKWTVFEAFLDQSKDPEIHFFETDIIQKSDFSLYEGQLFFTLYDSEGFRLAAPYILLVK